MDSNHSNYKSRLKKFEKKISKYRYRNRKSKRFIIFLIFAQKITEIFCYFLCENYLIKIKNYLTIAYLFLHLLKDSNILD